MESKYKIIASVIISSLIISSISLFSVYYFIYQPNEDKKDKKKSDNGNPIIVINRAPNISDLPNQMLAENSQLFDAFDLDDYSSDIDSDILIFSIIGNTEPNCGVSIDEENRIDIIPTAYWYGISNITIQVSDGKLKASDTFKVNVSETKNPPLDPYFPIDLDDLMDWLQINLDNLDQSDLDEIEDFGIDISNLDQTDLDTLANLINAEDVNSYIKEMCEGNIDFYDLKVSGLIIAALLFSDADAFRVYEYDNLIDEREDILWKYESFDLFNGDGWESTVPMELSSFPTYGDYYSYFSSYDKIKIIRPFKTNLFSNSFVVGSLFPIPYIIEDSFNAPDLDQTFLFKDDLGGVIADLSFNNVNNINITYDLFGLDIPTNDEINATAKEADYNPMDSKFQKFLQLPGGTTNYINNNLYFRNHWITLNTIIDSQDNAFMVANKIRNYLQSNFNLSFDSLINDPLGEGEDVVEWFCEHREGLYSEFASAFCAFTRSFGVASRFVDGFNSKLIEELFDSEEIKFFYPIKYKNIYNWAEIYVPWDESGLPGHGRWVQMDILYDNYGI
ncbi:MAG: transglutaminase-like domain-containing protein [Promethearchaeota archaeon]